MRSFICAIVFVLTLSYTESVFDLIEDDQCSSDFTGDNGVCVEANKCAEFKTQRNRLKICSFRGKIPLVCCPAFDVSDLVKNGDISVNRISAEKCDEYIKLIPDSSSDSSSARLMRSPQKTNNFSPTFVGGTRALINEFPHMSAIGWRRSNNKTDWLCGGSLISKKFVLSAAHCASLGGKAPDIVRIGDQDLNVNERGIFPHEATIRNIVVHPEYKHPIKYHDLALFELSVSVIFTKDVHPACLYQSSNDPAKRVEAMGYGQTSFGGPQSNALLKGYLTVVDKDQCKKSYEEDQSDLPQGITEQQMCAWDPNGNRDTCQGDSGGPLQDTKYSETSKKYYEIIGVTSFGKFCAAGIPGVYIRVFSYLDWIESVVWK